MRTRFLNVNYLSSSPTSSSFFSQTLGLLNLPIPHLSSLKFSLSEADALLFDYLPTIEISQESDGLRIDRALSKILEGIIPHIIDLEDDGYLESAVSGSPVGPGDRNVQEDVGEKETIETIWNTELADQLTKIKSAEDFGAQNGTKKMELVQFEIPEIKLHLEDSCISEKELMSIFSEVPQTENTLDINSQGPGKLYNLEAEESVYFIGDLNLENLLDPKADLVEDDDTGQGLLHSNFCPLEVNDINLGIPVRISAEYELMMLLEQARPEDFTQMGDLSILDCGKVLRRMEDDLLENPLHTCSSFLEADTSMELLMELDFISIGGTLYVPANSVCQGITDENGFLSLNCVVLEKLQILDEDPAPHLEVFNYGHFQELELCREIAEEDLNCKSFDELIVTHELALVDDIFKSMPIPVLWDYNMIKDELAREFIIDLKPQAVSANFMEFPFSFGFEREYPVKKPRMAREFSSCRSDHPVFPSAAEIDSGSYMKIPVNHQKQSVLEGYEYFLRKPHDNQLLMRNRNNMVNEDIDWRSSGIPENGSKQEERSNYRGTPLKNAVHSSTLQKGSPWSIEFLKRMQEKSMSRQDLLPSGASPSPNSKMNRSNSIKRRCPSIIEFFKYRGSSSCSKIPELKKQKMSSSSSGSLKNKKSLESLGPSWTPPDKRAKRPLSFTTNKKGGQSTLTWNDAFTT